ncbi:MAG: hypothetical protein R3Y55_03180 [Rikenellaceae bacterium]
MKKIFVLLALCTTIGISNLYAQKKLLVIDYFESEERDVHHIEEIRNQVVIGIQATNRLNLIDAYSDLSLQVDDQSDTRLKLIQNLGASYILIGNIDNVNLERKQNEGGSVHFNAEVKVTLKFIDATTGEIFASKSLTTVGGGSLFGAGSTEKKAISGAISAISGKLKRVIDEYFPLRGTIVEANEIKKNKLITCYVDLGSDHGVAKGQQAKVMQAKQIAGRNTLIEIGRLRCDEVIAEDLSICRIVKGQEELLTALNNGVELVVETITQRILGLDLE